MIDKQLPYGWVEATISEIADINPKKIDAAPETVAGFVPMSHAPTDFSDNLEFEEKYWSEIKKSYTNFREHDVLVAKVTPCFENGKAAIVKGLPNKIGAGSSEFYVIRPAIQEISSRFLFSIVKSYKFLSEGAANMTGAVGLRRVPRSFVETFPVLVPPLAEQKVIADKLDTLLAQVESTKARLERIPEILKTFRQSVLAAAVSGKLTEEWRAGAAFKEHSILFSSLIKESSVGLVRASGEQYEDSEGKLPYVKMNNIDNFWGYNTNNLKYVNASKEERIKYGLEKGDWLFNTRNSIELVGKSCVWKGKEGLLYNNNILRVKFNDAVLAEYVELFFKSPKGQQLLATIKSGTTNVAAIYQKQLFQLCFHITDLEEQTEIVRRVEELFAFADSIEQKTNAALERVNKLTQSILAKAFRGELTTDWRAANPELISGENSAEGLLAKIKTERAKLNQTKKRRGKSIEN